MQVDSAKVGDVAEQNGEPLRPADGFTILEVVIALTIFAIVVTGLATSTALALRIVGASNGRQIASQLATREIESLRRTSYATLGLTGPIASPVPGTLDDKVDVATQRFTVPDGPGAEALITTGPVVHNPATVPVRGFLFTVTRYVTWVDDPAISPSTQDYKRLTVAVQWRQKSLTGGPSRVVLSTLVTDAKVDF
ncbi:MAG TPA: prepilin-type N-terminal cleavage/methylation domain-containing protein [Acidimicrobiales bacterium]|nr:prepilin-type N-terminal cleavage/methylation domain-containing protein [Acidimicrobiales bacterium]